MKNIILLLISFIIFLSCSTNEKEEEKPIVIENIELLPSLNRTPKVNYFQTDVELMAKMSADNLNQDIFYEWEIEEIKIDIQSNLTSLNLNQDKNKLNNKKIIKDDTLNSTSNIKDLSSEEQKYNKIKNEKENDLPNISDIVLQKEDKNPNYYLYLSNNPLNCMLSIFKAGYYKITLRAMNTKEIKEKSIILKVGETLVPELFLKLNIPPLKQNIDNSNDQNKEFIKGKIYIQIQDDFEQNEKIVKIEGKNFINGWYNTHIKINPFYSFIITAGTHVVKDEDNTLYILSLGKSKLPVGYDSIYFDFLDKKMNTITTSPIVLKNFQKNSLLSIYKKGTKKWEEGDIYLTYLIWGLNSENKEEFLFYEKVLNEKDKSINTYLDNKFLVKIYIGSIGVISKNNNFFIFFSPEGLSTDELDTKKEREISGLPFGYLLGKLGEDGKIFPIGYTYTYLYSNNFPIFQLDEFGKYVEIKQNHPENKKGKN